MSGLTTKNTPISLFKDSVKATEKEDRQLDSTIKLSNGDETVEEKQTGKNSSHLVKVVDLKKEMGRVVGGVGTIEMSRLIRTGGAEVRMVGEFVTFERDELVCCGVSLGKVDLAQLLRVGDEFNCHLTRLDTTVGKAKHKVRMGWIDQDDVSKLVPNLEAENNERDRQSEKRNFLCENCHKSFKLKWHLKSHYKKCQGVAKKTKQFCCNECDGIYSSKRSLKKHILTCKPWKPYLCQYCNKEFGTFKEHYDHKRKNHSSVKCEYCDKIISTESNLKRHVFLKHKGLRPSTASRVLNVNDIPRKVFKCENCSKVFHNKSNLNRHIKNHNPEKKEEEEKSDKQQIQGQQLQQQIQGQQQQQQIQGQQPQQIQDQQQQQIQEIQGQLDKIPLDYISCERLQNEDDVEEVKPSQSCCSLPSSLTPHKIIKVKEVSSICNPPEIPRTPEKISRSSMRAANKRSAGYFVDSAKKAPSSSTKADKLDAVPQASHKVTEHIPIRRSERKTKTEVIKEEFEAMQSRLFTNNDSDLDIEVAYIENKGRGIVSKRPFAKGQFVVEYAGELIDMGVAKNREAQYSMDTSKGCFMYYVKHMGRQFCIDATRETGRLGRLMNHSRVSPNCMTKVIMLGNTPRLIIVAKKDFDTGVELLYDYGDRSKESLKAHPWLAL